MSLKKTRKKRRIGYARVSTKQQDLAHELKVLKRAGCTVSCSDSASGKSITGRPKLQAAFIEAPQTVVSDRVPRNTRSRG